MDPKTNSQLGKAGNICTHLGYTFAVIHVHGMLYKECELFTTEEKQIDNKTAISLKDRDTIVAIAMLGCLVVKHYVA